MMQEYTEIDLIRYLYKELSVTDYFEIENAIENDSILRRKYNRLQKAFNTLPSLRIIPSQKVINRVLQYSCNVTEEVQC